jgi:hypothetical protein
MRIIKQGMARGDLKHLAMQCGCVLDAVAELGYCSNFDTGPTTAKFPIFSISSFAAPHLPERLRPCLFTADQPRVGLLPFAETRARRD